MKKWLMIFLVQLFLFADTCPFVGSIKGREYNSFLKGWIPREVAVYACPDPTYPYLITTDSVLSPKVYINGKDRRRLISSIKKAKRWAVKAKKEHVPTFSKRIFSNRTAYTSYDALHNSLKVDFFTANRGYQNDLILYLVDFDNQFKKDKVYIDSDHFDQFASILKSAQMTYQEARKAKQLAKEFK